MVIRILGNAVWFLKARLVDRVVEWRRARSLAQLWRFCMLLQQKNTLQKYKHHTDL